MTGQVIDGTRPRRSPDYWARNVRETVRFADAASVLADGRWLRRLPRSRDPHPALSSAARRDPAVRGTGNPGRPCWRASMRRGSEDARDGPCSARSRALYSRALIFRSSGRTSRTPTASSAGSRATRSSASGSGSTSHREIHGTAPITGFSRRNGSKATASAHGHGHSNGERPWRFRTRRRAHPGLTSRQIPRSGSAAAGFYEVVWTSPGADRFWRNPQGTVGRLRGRGSGVAWGCGSRARLEASGGRCVAIFRSVRGEAYCESSTITYIFVVRPVASCRRRPPRSPPVR